MNFFSIIAALFTIILFIAQPVLISAQTCIIVKRKRNEIYIGADSRVGKVSYDFINNKADTSYDEYCKIKSLGKFYFTSINHYAHLNSKNAYKAAANSETFDDFINSYIELFGKELSDSLNMLYKNSRYHYDQLMKSHGEQLTVLMVCGFEKDSSKIFVITSEISNNPNSTPNIEWPVYVIRGEAAMALGKEDEIKNILNKPETWKEGYVKAINKLIAIETKAHPLFVGPPVNIIRLTRDGSFWIQQSRKCKLDTPQSN